jgi:hypothetical protein
MYISASADDVGVSMAARFLVRNIVGSSFVLGLLMYFLLAYFPKVGLCDLHIVCVCVYVYLPLLTIEWLDQSSLNLAYVTWHLSPSRWRTS